MDSRDSNANNFLCQHKNQVHDQNENKFRLADKRSPPRTYWQAMSGRSQGRNPPSPLWITAALNFEQSPPRRSLRSELARDDWKSNSAKRRKKFSNQRELEESDLRSLFWRQPVYHLPKLPIILFIEKTPFIVIYPAKKQKLRHRGGHPDGGATLTFHRMSNSPISPWSLLPCAW